MFEQAAHWLTEQGLDESLVRWIVLIARILLVLVLSWGANLVVRKILERVIRPVVRRSRTRWDDAMIHQGVLGKLAHLAPAWIIYILLPPLLNGYPRLQAFAVNLTEAYMILTITMALAASVEAFREIASGFERARRAPLRVISQAARIVVWAVGFIFIVATLFDRSPAVFVSGLGAMTAVLMLIFKDSILGLVAGLQIASNDLVRPGDWIEMPRYGADGDVLEVGLTTVKVQNWNKTISSVPTYAFISDSFKNWRGMDEAGGRRIKRAVNLDLTSIRFCDDEMLQRFRRIQYINEYIERKQAELGAWNQEMRVDESTLANGRRLTNVGTFRAYLQAYLRDNPNLHSDGLTFLVRQLAPGPGGLPIEIYVFSKDQRWVQYEGIQSDIFDHVLAVIPEFDLRVFQEPTGADLQRLSSAV